MSSKDKKKNKLAQSSASWLGVKPGQLNRNIQTSNKSVQQAQTQQHKTSAQTAKAAAPSSVSWRGTTPSQVARPAQQQTAARNTQTTVNRPQITPGRVSPAQQQRNAAQSARTLAQNDNSMRARIARSHEAERQRLAANAAAIKQDKSRLASNSLLWHQTTDASRRRQLERENAAIRTRRGFGYDARTGSTFDTKGNELSLGARMIYGGKAETAKQFQQVAQTRDFVRDTSRTAAQPSIYDVARGVQADDPYYALEAGAKAHNIVNGLLNRSGDTWTDADTKARDDARTALQNEMTALFQHYGVDYQPRWNGQQTADMLRRAGADEGTVAYAMENLRLRDSTDRLGQGLEAIGKRAVASVPSLIDTAKQALANRNEDYENDEYRSLTEREQALETQLQSMVSQNADGSVPEDYQRIYDELQNVRNRANALKTTKGVDPNAWSQTMLREANEAQANAEAGLAPAPRWLTEQAISLAGNAPSMAISALPGGTILGSALIGAQAAGQRMFELNEQGKNAGEALGRGLVSGVIEAATEKLPLEQMSKILRAGGTNAVKNILRQMGTEATEEGISYFLNYVSDRAASDPDAEFSLAELVQSAAGGAFGGLIFGAAGNVASRLALGDANAVPAEFDAGRYTRDVTAELQKADADLRAAKSLLEGAVRDRAIASAYQKISETLDAFTSQQIAEKAEVWARESLLTEGMQAPERTAATAPVEVAAPKLLDAAAQRTVEHNRAAFDRARNIAQDAVQYGKTPEQAVMEAKVKRESAENAELHQRLVDAYGELQMLELGLPENYSDSELTRKIRLKEEVRNLKELLGERGVNTDEIPAPEISRDDIPDNLSVVETARMDDWTKRAEGTYGSPERYAPEGSDGPAPVVPSPLKPGDKIRTWSRNNLGYAYDAEGPDGTVMAYFANMDNGREAKANVPSGDWTRIMEPSEYEHANAAQVEKAADAALNPSLDESTAQIDRFEQARADRVAAQDAERHSTAVREGVERAGRRNSGLLDRFSDTSDETSIADTGDRSALARAELDEVIQKNPGFFRNIGAGNDRNPTEFQKSTFREEMKRTRWLSDTDYQARHEQAQALRASWEQVRELDKQIEYIKKKASISDADERLLQATLVNRQTNAFNDTDAPEVLMHLYDLANERNTLMEPLREYSQSRREALALSASDMADKIATYATDKSIAAAYSRETMERNSYDIFGKDHTREAEELNGTYYEPVHKAVADKTKYVNSLKERVAKMHLNKHESAMVQMLMEGEYGGIAEYAKNNHIDLTPQLGTKLKKAAQEFRLMYNDMYERICDTLISNGMWDSIPGYLKNYAPHFTLDAPQNMLQRIRFALGLGKDSTLTLRTDLAGITDEFRPGKKWFGNLLHREGEITDYDAVAGFERYINTAGDVIFLTDSVQNLRTLEDAIRYRLSDEGTREQISKIRNDISLDPLTRYQELDKAYNVDDSDSVHKLLRQKRAGMTGYVSNLREYINNLAGKKSKADRGWEDMLGRQMYNVARNVEGRVAANMIAANPGSWITNFIPITQATGEISTPNLLRAMRDTVTSAIKDDGFEDASAFLTNRRGTERLTQTATQRASEIMGKPMECIDMLTSNVVVRGKYLENIQHGMDMQSAFEDADRFAANLMADRSQGAMPTAFNAVNPVRKIFTMFQLEVNNQLSYLFKDLPRAKQSASKLAWAYTKVFVGAYAFNKIYHELTGRDSAFDPIGMIADAFGQLTDDDEDDKKKRALNAATSLGGSIAENLPFIGGVLGGGRVPVSSALPSFGTIADEYRQGYDTKRVAQTAAKELAKPATYLLLPFGGGAVNRAMQGYMTVKNGGSYRYDKNGEKMLQFPVFGQKPEDWAKAMLFGKSSLTEAQNWKDNGYDSLYAKETKAFDTIREHMRWHKDENGNVVDNSEAAYAAILALRKAEETAKKQHPDNYQDIAATLKRQILMNDKDLSVGQKEFLDRELISGGQSGDYSSRDAFDISQNVREGRQQAANVALKHGISADTFADLDGYLYALTQEQNDDGTKTYTTNTALGKVLEQIEANENYTAGEKEALSGYLLITAMSESDKDKYEEEVRGLVNPSDYVRFKSDLAEYKKEFEGTGADHKANIAEILRSYTNLTDEQRSVLMNTYSDTAAGNRFHVSDLEKSLADNSLYKDLNGSGREKLRSYCNEYEQAIADGKELDEWKAKAYMAQKEVGISPAVYAMFKVALDSIDTDGGNHKNAELTEAVKLIPDLTDKQRGYLWQAAKGGDPSKNNPWGKTNVTKYTGGSGSGSAVNPVEGGTISSGFGPRSSPTEGASSIHKAIDIAAPLGTAVRAAMPGKIVEVTKGYNGGYGNTVSVDHGNGIITKYHHMQNGSIDGVSVGQEVTAGQQIGAVGSTGISTGPHLDFQVVKDGDFVDPRKYIPGYGTGNDYFYSGSASAGAIASGRATAESSGSSKKSGGSGRSGGTSWSGLKNLKKLPTFK